MTDKNKVVKGFVGKRGKPYAEAVAKDREGTITTLTPRHRVLKNKELAFTEGTPEKQRRQILRESKCARTVHSLVRGGAASGSVSPGVGVVAVSGTGGPEGPTPPSTTETNQTPPGVGSGGEGVAASGSVSPGVGVVAVSGTGGPEGPTPPSTTETNQTPPGVGSGGEGVASLPSAPLPEETAETNQAPGGGGGGGASPPSDPPAPESETNKTKTPPTPPETLETREGASDSFKEEETVLRKIQEDVREIKEMLEARREVETALVALVRDLELRTRAVVDVDEAKGTADVLMIRVEETERERKRPATRGTGTGDVRKRERPATQGTGTGDVKKRKILRPPENERTALLDALKKIHQEEHLRPGTYVKKLGKQRVATCYTCKKKFTSQRGFEKHVDAEVHFPVPQEYAATASTADEVVVAATASTADEVVVAATASTADEVVVGSKVKLKLCDDLIASGEVVSPEGKQVHGVDIGLNEVVVRLDEVDGADIQHPIHLYPLEKGSFTAWKCNDLVVIG